jgi:hypothetical protein
VLAMLLLVVLVQECWCCTRQADRQCCAMLVMLLLVVTVLGDLGGRGSHSTVHRWTDGQMEARPHLEEHLHTDLMLQDT